MKAVLDSNTQQRMGVLQLETFLKTLEREARKLRKRQYRLMQEANAALFDCGIRRNPAIYGQAVAAWIRDDQTHVTTRDLLDMAKSAMEGDDAS
jgi:hypothetical protein